MLTKQKRFKSPKIMNFARGRDCQIRIPNVCNHNPETSVMAHIGGGGMGTKNSDLFVAISCSECHKTVDSSKNHISHHYEGMQRTQQMLLDAGLVNI